MMASWVKNGFEQPVLLMNKDNDAAAQSGSAAAKERAERSRRVAALNFAS